MPLAHGNLPSDRLELSLRGEPLLALDTFKLYWNVGKTEQRVKERLTTNHLLGYLFWPYRHCCEL